MKLDMSTKAETGYPDFSAYPFWGAKNLKNLALCLLAPMPSVAFSMWLFRYFEPGAIPSDPGLAGLATLDGAAAFLLHNPLVTVNLLFFVNVCIGFWLVALVQRSSWLIDPYWTLLPPLMGLFFWAHPLAVETNARTVLALSLLGIWSARLTYNYFRREHWRFGFREDWRFAKKRAESKHFWWVQFFYVYFAQQFMLVGLSLPFWALSFSDAPMSAIDGVFVMLAMFGLLVAHVADTELDQFMKRNRARVAAGLAKIQLLDTGIWRYSRHPSYFGEQVFWWSIAGLGVMTGHYWVVVGTVLNSIVLAVVTIMTERRMLEVPARREIYREYIRRTSACIPWIPREPKGLSGASGVFAR